jgi:hypothetical protein
LPSKAFLLGYYKQARYFFRGFYEYCNQEPELLAVKGTLCLLGYEKAGCKKKLFRIDTNPKLVRVSKKLTKRALVFKMTEQPNDMHSKLEDTVDRSSDLTTEKIKLPNDNFKSDVPPGLTEETPERLKLDSDLKNLNEKIKLFEKSVQPIEKELGPIDWFYQVTKERARNVDNHPLFKKGV